MNKELQSDISDHLSKSSSAPFLFVGSGLSRRYIGLENFGDLLKLFCKDIKNYEYYFSKSDGDLPSVAQEMSYDFHEIWWEKEKYNEIKEATKGQLINRFSALKIAISQYISEKCEVALYRDEYSNEIELLQNSNVDGIITTNWDTFLEHIFPSYKVFVGQQQLIFSNPQSVGEVYKVHGCIHEPNSMVLTRDEYNVFEKNNPYLSAKLITLFVEHPIIFLGYSLKDPHMLNLLGSLVDCLGNSNIEKLRNNLIFTQRCKNEEKESFSDSVIATEYGTIPIKILKISNFGTLYSALDNDKRKIPVRILRYFKEQLYELVKSNKPIKRIAVVNYDELEDQENIEFVVGIGATNILSEKGYSAVERDEIFKDLLHDDKNYDPAILLTKVVPELIKRSPFLPIFKYLKKLSIENRDQYKASCYDLDRIVNMNIADYCKHKQYHDSFMLEVKGKKDTSEIIGTFTANKSAIYLALQSPSEMDVDEVEAFLLLNEEYLFNGSYASYYKKLACYYDRVKNGWFD